MILLMLFTVSIYATTIQEVPEEGSAGWWVASLAPIITLGVTYLIRLIVPLIPGWMTMLVVTLLSMAVAWIAQKLDGLGDMSFLAQVGYGLLAIVINQFYRAFTGGNTAHSRKK